MNTIRHILSDYGCYLNLYNSVLGFYHRATFLPSLIKRTYIFLAFILEADENLMRRVFITKKV